MPGRVLPPGGAGGVGVPDPCQLPAHVVPSGALGGEDCEAAKPVMLLVTAGDSVMC